MTHRLDRRLFLTGALASPLLASPLLAALPRVVLAQATLDGQPVPEHNRADLTEPPPRPPLGDGAERAARLLEAIRTDDPALAEDFFLPQAAFRLIKGISDPDALWARIHRMYEDDIHELHASLGDLTGAELVRLQFTGRRGWVRVREETNRLPYWAQRHSWLVYRVGGEERRFEVRTMIAWDDRWYITHLSEFR